MFQSKIKAPILDHLLMAFGLIIGLCFFIIPVVGWDLQYFPGDLGDGRLNLYFLEHAHKLFRGDLITPYWDVPFMYPEENVLAYSDTLIGAAPFYSIFRWMGMDSFTSYQMWYILLSAFNFIAAFYFLKYLFKNPYAALLGAFLFAFSLALQSQLFHAQTYARFAVPLAFLYALRFKETFLTRYFFGAVFMLVLQIYCGIYTGFMLAVPLALFLLLVLVADLYKQDWKNRRGVYLKIPLVLLVNGLLLLPLMLHYVSRRQSAGWSHFKMVSETLPSIKSYFFAPSGSLFWNFLDRVGMDSTVWWDNQIFVGAMGTVSFVISFFFILSKLPKVKFRISELSAIDMLLISGFITFFLYLRIGDITAYSIVYVIPGFSSMRSLARIINIELLFFGIALGWVYLKWFQRYFKYQPLIVLALFVLLVCDNYFDVENSNRTEVVTAQKRVEKLEQVLASLPPEKVISYEPHPVEGSSVYFQIDAMLTAQNFNLKSINGYTASYQNDFGEYWSKLDSVSRNYWLTGRNIPEDTIYVIDKDFNLNKVNITSLKNREEILRKEKEIFETTVNYIRNNERWMEDIRKKAQKRGISVDSMVVIDALWHVNQNK